jgi:copper resistance protein C
MSVLGRVIAGVLLVVIQGVIGAGPASAHATLVNSNPVDGTSLAKMPAEVSLTFDENVGTPFVSVIAPDGSNLAVGDAVVLDGTVTQQVHNSDVTGAYQIAYRVVSADVHPITGTVSFNLSAHGSIDTNTAATSTPATGGPQNTTTPFLENGNLLVLIAAALGLLAVGLAISRRPVLDPNSEDAEAKEAVRTP